jgi:hypothetical protein
VTTAEVQAPAALAPIVAPVPAPAPVPVRAVAEFSSAPVHAAEPIAQPRPVVPPRPIPELPPIALTLPPESDLVLVETVNKAPVAPEPEAPAGPRRVRPPRVEVAAEPLQIVETQKDKPLPAP